MTVTVQIIASSSRGNCYALHDGESTLLIECGTRFKKIREKLGFSVSSVDGCLISHEHGDHSSSVKFLLRAGVDCYMSGGTAGMLSIEDHHRVNIVHKLKQFTFAGWTVLPYDTQHDAADPFGFLISRGDDKILFATDTSYIHYRFKGVTIFLLECNYDPETIQRNVNCGVITKGHKDRILRSHFGMDNVVDMLQANDLSKCREIHLIHLSDGNANERLIVNTVQKATGIPTYAAEA